MTLFLCPCAVGCEKCLRSSLGDVLWGCEGEGRRGEKRQGRKGGADQTKKDSAGKSQEGGAGEIRRRMAGEQKARQARERRRETGMGRSTGGRSNSQGSNSPKNNRIFGAPTCPCYPIRCCYLHEINNVLVVTRK